MGLDDAHLHLPVLLGGEQALFQKVVVEVIQIEPLHVGVYDLLIQRLLPLHNGPSCGWNLLTASMPEKVLEKLQKLRNLQNGYWGAIDEIQRILKEQNERK